MNLFCILAMMGGEGTDVVAVEVEVAYGAYSKMLGPMEIGLRSADSRSRDLLASFNLTTSQLPHIVSNVFRIHPSVII